MTNEIKKKKTISTRFSDWMKLEPIWSRLALILMCSSVGVGLFTHLWILSGMWRTIGLIYMIVAALITEAIYIFRKIWWWASFWGYVILGVIGWEIASYFFG